MLVALHHGRFILTKLDRYDWHFKKMEIWGFFALSVIAWPLLLIKPRNLMDPSKMYQNGKFGPAEMARAKDRITREKDELQTNPPPCGSLIRYRQGYGREKTYGEFFLRAIDVEAALTNHLKHYPHLAKDDEGAILNWVRNRNESLTEPTDVPKVWGRFKFVMNYIIRTAAIKVRCLKCGIVLSSDQLVTNDDQGRPGWNSDRIICPNGHKLLAVETVHIMVPIKSSQK